MKKLIFLILGAFPILVQAQYLELGAAAGLSNYLGDLSLNSQKVLMRNSGFSGAVFGRYNFNALLATRLQLNYLSVRGSDALATDDVIRQRNLSFEADVVELALIGELNVPGYNPYNFERPLSPYLFAGIGAFYFNPAAVFNGRKTALRPLATEGQGLPGRPSPYGAISLAVSLGAGIKYAITDKLNLGVELGARMTFTDYLDDVGGTYMSYPELLAAKGELSAALGNRSGELQGGEPVIVPTGTPRGDNNPRDWYFSTVLSLSYNFIDNGLVGSRSRAGRKRAGCRN